VITENGYLVCLILFTILWGITFYLHERDRSRWTKERDQLITRIMARDLPEYIEAQAKMQPMQVVTVADLKREIAPPREEGLEVG
jgi:hypothetical protein